MNSLMEAIVTPCKSVSDVIAMVKGESAPADNAPAISTAPAE